eukprot:24665-Eustigmatos_ZCMA.PRE.1
MQGAWTTIDRSRLRCTFRCLFCFVQCCVVMGRNAWNAAVRTSSAARSDTPARRRASAHTKTFAALPAVTR